VSLLIFLAAAQDPVYFDPAVHEATKTFTFEEFLIVPVRIHRLRSKTAPILDCRLKEVDIRRILGKANRIWNRAGIALAAEVVVEEEALVPEGFQGTTLDEFKSTRPPAGLAPGMLHVYYVRDLPTNGVYMGPDAIFVKDGAALRRVKGGVDEPIPRVTSHEIGHALGLPHRQDTINLMASGTTGWSLGDEEIEAARRWCANRDWVLTPQRALDAGHAALLATLPGESPLKDRARRLAEERGN
jgi:hypothetical protein